MKAKKLIALLLVFVMVLTAMTACGVKDPEPEANPEANQPAQKEEVNNETPSDETEEPVELSIMVSYLPEIEEGSISDAWDKILEEKLNVKLDWVIVPSSSYEDNLQLTLINDDKPDVFCFPTAWLTQTTFSDACENGMFYDISEMLPNYPNLMAHTSQISWDALDIYNDGRIWGVPRSTMSRADGFGLRKDWLENLNIDYTEGEFLTLDEFYDILYAFTYDDPDGNGIDDTYGFKAYSNADGSLYSGLSRIFHIGTGDGWYELEDGTITNLKYSKDHDYYKQYLEFARKCWEAGVIEPDAFAIDAATSNERMNSYGCYEVYPGNMYVEQKQGAPRDDLDVYCPGVIVPGDPIDTYTYGDYSNGIWDYYAISTTCEHPEKVLEVMDYILSDEAWTNLKVANVEGFSFTIDENGNYDWSLRDALAAEDEKNGTNLRNNGLLNLFLRRSDGSEFFINHSWTPENRERVTKLIDVTQELYWPCVDRGYKPEIANDAAFIEYKNYLIQEEAKIICGDSPVEYWDELLDGFYDAGYDKYVEDMVAYVESFG